MKLLVGADPELFVSDNGKLVSCHGLLPGTKAEPHRVERGAVQVDGMAAEFNIDPAGDEETFITNLNTVQNALRELLGGRSLEAIPVAHFGHEYIQSQPQEARELGCEPDFNAWLDGAINPKPNVDAPFRTASGHVHLGWKTDDPCFDEAIAVTKQMDFFLGLESLFWDDDKERRQLYGRAGCMRPKHYGVEYRVLSNAWLRSEELSRKVFQLAQRGFSALVNGDMVFERYDNIESVINNSDKEEARRILNDYYGAGYV